MDRKDSKPDRPSLFKVELGQSGTKGVSPRILADMRGDTAAPRAVPTQRRPIFSGKGAWLLLGVGVLGVGAIAFLLNRDSTPSGHEYTDLAPAQTVEPAVRNSSAAVLVESEETQTSGYNDPLDMIARNAAAAPKDSTAPAIPSAVAKPKPVVVATHDPRPRPASVTSSPASVKAPASSGKDSDLLAALLENIRENPNPPRAQKKDPQTLDGLIDQILAREAAQNTASNGATNANSAKLQTRLRNCPAANTMEGIKCRQKVCASYSGTDSACPKL